MSYSYLNDYTSYIEISDKNVSDVPHLHPRHSKYVIEPFRHHINLKNGTDLYVMVHKLNEYGTSPMDNETAFIVLTCTDETNKKRYFFSRNITCSMLDSIELMVIDKISLGSGESLRKIERSPEMDRDSPASSLRCLTESFEMDAISISDFEKSLDNDRASFRSLTESLERDKASFRSFERSLDNDRAPSRGLADTFPMYKERERVMLTNLARKREKCRSMRKND